MTAREGGDRAGEFGLAETLHQAGAGSGLAPGLGSDETQAAPLPSPAGSARYEPRAEIGRGGMGRVLEAQDRQFNRIVAIKELHAKRDDSGSRRRFALEAMITGNLEHPAIVPVYERGERDGTPFYVMRRVRGRTLVDALSEAPGTTGATERLKLIATLIRVAHAVGYAHERGVVHRDIKPQNIMIDRHGEVFVLDWGIAKVRGFASDGDGAGAAGAGAAGAGAAGAGTGGSSGPGASAGAGAGGETAHGSVLGTPAYMAPEQAAGDVDRIDERTDVFALGALLYHVLTGRAPYSREGASVERTLSDAASANFPPLAVAAPRAPAALAAICARAMARQPEQRYATAAALADALEEAAAGALEGRRAGLLGAAAAGMMGLAMALALFSAVMIWRTVSSLHEQGPGALVVVALFAIGALLGAIEWVTRGRHTLTTLVLACGLATLLVGVANAFGGLELALRGSLDAGLVAQPARYREVLTYGIYEALGNIPSASALAAVLFLLWALLARRGATSKRLANSLNDGSPRRTRGG